MPLLRSLGRIVALLAALASAACVNTPLHRGSGRFVERSVNVGGAAHRYQVFVPSAAAGGARPAVVVFLHGSGERGRDNQVQTEVGIGSYVRTHRDDFPAIVVFPQAPEETEWNQNVEMVFAELEAATREFGGDRARTYLTGLSMGGFGTWDLALREPARFAALVPICGGLVAPARPSMSVAPLAGSADPVAELVRRMRAMPVWMFHGAQDVDVSPQDDRRLAAAFRNAGAADARYTEFPDAAHNSWDPAYQHTPALWPWLFSQRLP